MDINLHSFILVVGLIVILFIVIDGIKKVREARSNQFDDDVLDSDILATDVPLDQNEESNFREFEIADDVVKGSFVSEGSANSNFESPHSEDDLENILGVVGANNDITAASFSEPESPSVDSSLMEAPIIEPSVMDAPVVDDVYSADTDASTEALESFSVDNDFDENEDMVNGALKNKATVQPRKIHTDQPSKSEVESRKKQIEEEQGSVQEVVEPLQDIPETVPVLMEPVELGLEVDPNPPQQQEMHLPEFVQQTLQDEPIVALKSEPDFESFSIDDVESFGEEDSDQFGSAVATERKVEVPVGEKLEERPAAEEIFVINVLKENGPLLKGSELHHIFKACDMRHGEMDIFHRFEEENAQGKIQFSVVNALKPGSFDLTTIDDMETKGISMFMSLPGPEDPMAAFDAMAEVGLVFARNFNANLYDESHSDLTPQTLEHYRNRIREYSRKQFSKK